MHLYTYLYILFLIIKSHNILNSIIQLLVRVREANDRLGHYYNEFTSYVADLYSYLSEEKKKFNASLRSWWDEDNNKGEEITYQVWVRKVDCSTRHLVADDVAFIVESVPDHQPPQF